MISKAKKNFLKKKKENLSNCCEIRSRSQTTSEMSYICVLVYQTTFFFSFGKSTLTIETNFQLFQYLFILNHCKKCSINLFNQLSRTV